VAVGPVLVCFELRLRVVVVGLPLLAVYKVTWWTRAPSGRRCRSEYLNRMNQDSMWSIWLAYLYCLMSENQPRIKSTVLSNNLSSSPPRRNSSSSGQHFTILLSTLFQVCVLTQCTLFLYFLFSLKR
jgi:hypothetical protein